jgi:hypothetical protein
MAIIISLFGFPTPIYAVEDDNDERLIHVKA